MLWIILCGVNSEIILFMSHPWVVALTSSPTKTQSNGLFPQKSKQRVLRIYFFWKSPMEFLDLSLCPSKSQRKQVFTTGNSEKLWHLLQVPRSKTNTHGSFTKIFLEHHWNFYFFFNWPQKFPHALSSIPLEIPCLQPPCLGFFWNSTMLILKYDHSGNK